MSKEEYKKEVDKTMSKEEYKKEKGEITLASIITFVLASVIGVHLVIKYNIREHDLFVLGILCMLPAYFYFEVSTHLLRRISKQIKDKDEQSN